MSYQISISDPIKRGDDRSPKGFHGLLTQPSPSAGMHSVPAEEKVGKSDNRSQLPRRGCTFTSVGVGVYATPSGYRGSGAIPTQASPSGSLTLAFRGKLGLIGHETPSGFSLVIGQ